MSAPRRPFGESVNDGELWAYRAGRAVARELGCLFRVTDGRKNDLQFMVSVHAEVKTDHKSAQTGNIYIETQNTRLRADSGLMLDGVEAWIICVPHLGALFLCRWSDLLSYISLPETDLRQVNGGDDNSHGYLIPIDRFEKLPFVRKISLEASR